MTELIILTVIAVLAIVAVVVIAMAFAARLEAEHAAHRAEIAEFANRLMARTVTEFAVAEAKINSNDTGGTNGSAPNREHLEQVGM